MSTCIFNNQDKQKAIILQYIFSSLHKLPSILLIFILSIQLFPTLAVASIGFVLEKTSPFSSGSSKKNHCTEECCKSNNKNNKDKEEGGKCYLDEIRDLQLFVQQPAPQYYYNGWFIKKPAIIYFTSVSKGFLAHVFQPPEGITYA